ncbi:MAG: hypothetical protein AAFU71_16110, partial [Cyanobacteria bacterium J06632_22]
MTVAVKTTLCACAALLAGAGIPALTRPAIAQTNPPQANQSTQTTFDFSGDYAPGQWQVRARNSGGGFQFDGMDAAGTTADSLTLIGSDLGGIDGCLVDTPPDYCAPGFTALYVQVQVPEWSIIQFNWDYTTYDIWQDPAYDPFGYVLPQFNAEGELTEGKFVAITDPDGSPQQSGEFSIELKADSFFALQIGTLDNQFGPAV